MIAILFTVLVQSSSTCTSVIVSLVSSDSKHVLGLVGGPGQADWQGIQVPSDNLISCAAAHMLQVKLAMQDNAISYS